MQNFLNDAVLWCSAKANLLDTPRNFTLNVYIKEKSISNSFLQIKEETTPNFALVPMNSNIIFSLQGDILTLSFVQYNQITFLLSFSSSSELEMLVSHLSKTTSLENQQTDQFVQENTNFLKLLNNEKAQIPKKSFSISSTILMPLSTNQQAKAIWQENIIKNNAQFYLDKKEIRFSFLTWNVAGHRPKEDVLTDIVRCFKVPIAPSDIIIIAFQEIDMGMKSVVTGNSNLSDKWTEIVTIAQKLFEETQFDLIANESCGSVYCAALARKELQPKPVVSEIQQIKLGAGGIFANKAAILVPIKLGEAKIMAVACHLAPHEPNMEERNEQWRLIARTVGDDVDFFSMMGDLNYRLTLDYDSVVERATSDKVDELFEWDQLKNSQKKCKILEKFKEAEIRFRPTYKFDKNCDVYDTSPKHRTPSYTDRILIRTGLPRLEIGCKDYLEFETDSSLALVDKNHTFKVDFFLPNSQKKELNFPQPPQCICYRSLKCTFSDHRPVHAAYKYTIPVINETRLNLLKDIIEAKYEEITNNSVPKAHIEPASIHYMNQKSMTINIVNDSPVWANWSLRTPPKGIHILPVSGRLYAFDTQVLNITFDAETYKNDSIFFDIQGGSQCTLNFISDSIVN